MTPMFSIIIPVYNVAPYLRECLDSVLAQTFTDWEAVCIDDGSTDESGAILDGYAEKDTRFRVIHKRNEGVEAARQMALDAARGEYVGWVDADDTVDEDFLFTAHSKMVECRSDMIWFDYFEENNGVRQLIKTECSESPEEMMRAIISGQQWAVLWNKVFRRQFIIDNDIRFSGQGCVTMEDSYFVCRFLRSHPNLKYVPQAFYHYQIRNQSLVHREMDDLGAQNWMNAANCIMAQVRGIVSDDLLALWRLKVKYGLVYSKMISHQAYYDFYPELDSAAPLGVRALWRLLFRLATKCKLRPVIRPLMSVYSSLRG